jgi:uncharacterized protein (DUF1015 family)
MSSGAVRPFESRVVRQESAELVVGPMVDALDEGERRRRNPVPATAYDEAPRSLFVYRMARGADHHVGVVADVRLDAFADGGVLGHEAVEPDRVDALARYYADQPSRSEPVALLHGYSPGARRRVDEACRDRPLLQFGASDGFEHTVWRVAGDEATAELAAELGRGVQYIADGHHRVAARLRAWEQSGRPTGAGVLCVIFPTDGLRLSAFHRRVLGPVDAGALLDAASGGFEVRRVPAAPEAHGIALHVAECWYDLVHAGARPDGAAGLDVAVLQGRLLGPALGITGPHDPRLETVPAHLPLRQAVSRSAEDGGALFVLRPPTLRTLTEIADRGEVMPPKTTYFAPKPYAGIFLT